MNDRLHHVGLDVSSFGEEGKHHLHIPGKITFALLALSLVTVGCIILLDDADTSSAATCGDNLEYEYTDSNHTLTISQPDKNAAATMTYSTYPPWDSHVAYIETIIFDAPKLTNIADNAFNGCSQVTSIEIPDSVTTIGQGAFNGCNKLSSFVIPNSVISIGEWAFTECTALSSVTIGNSVTTIPVNAFYKCAALSSVTIGNSVANIEKNAFRECASLESIVIPDSVTTMSDYVFRDCTSLKSIVIPDSVTAIGQEVFAGCTHLESAIIGNNVTKIKYLAFSGCTNLESVIIGNNVTEIETEAFPGCANLTKIWFGNSVTSIAGDSFPASVEFYIDSIKVTLPTEAHKLQGLYFLKTASGFVNNVTELSIEDEKSYTYDGTVHSLVAESDKYSMENCSSKDAGNFHAKVTANPGFRLKWTDSEGTHETTVCEFDWSIAPIVIGLTWGETVFKYDGNSHVPVATATGLIGGDVCTVTVSGAQIDAGKYTATASSLSNSNYVLPSNVTCEFTIEGSGGPVSGEEPMSIGMSIALVIIVAISLIVYLSGRKN